MDSLQHESMQHMGYFLKRGSIHPENGFLTTVNRIPPGVGLCLGQPDGHFDQHVVLGLVTSQRINSFHVNTDFGDEILNRSRRELARVELDERNQPHQTLDAPRGDLPSLTQSPTVAR